MQWNRPLRNIYFMNLIQQRPWGVHTLRVFIFSQVEMLRDFSMFSFGTFWEATRVNP